MDLIVNKGDILKLNQKIRLNDLIIDKDNIVDVIDIDGHIPKLKVKHEGKYYIFYANNSALFTKLSSEKIQRIKEERENLLFIKKGMYLETINDINCPGEKVILKGTRALVIESGENPVILLQEKDGIFAHIRIVNKLDYKITESHKEPVLKEWKIEKIEFEEQATFDNVGYTLELLDREKQKLIIQVSGLDKHTLIHGEDDLQGKLLRDIESLNIKGISNVDSKKVFQILADYIAYKNDAFHNFKEYSEKIIEKEKNNVLINKTINYKRLKI